MNVIEGLVKEIDKNGDGQIDFNEVCNASPAYDTLHVTRLE